MVNQMDRLDEKIVVLDCTGLCASCPEKCAKINVP